MEIKRIFSRREERVRQLEVLDPQEQRVLAGFFNLREASFAEVFATLLVGATADSDIVLPSEVERITGSLLQRGFIGVSDQKPIVEDAYYFELSTKGKDAIKQIRENPTKFREQVEVRV